MVTQTFPVIDVSQFQDVPLDNSFPMHREMDHTTLDITGEKDSQRKTKWYDNEHKIVMLATFILLSIAFFSLAFINLYLSKKAAAETRPRPITQIPIIVPASTTDGRYRTTLPGLLTTTVQYKVTAESDAFPKSITWDDEETTITEEPTTEIKTIPTDDSTTTLKTIPLSVGHDRTAYYTKLDFAIDEWYKPIYSLFNSPATYEEAEKICETPLTIGNVRHDQTLPSVHMYEALINKVVEIMPTVYGGKAMWTGFYTPSSKIGDLNDVQHRVYGPTSDNSAIRLTRGEFYMVHNTQSFCPPFNDALTAEQVWNEYKMKYRMKTAKTRIQIVKDFTYSNEPKTNWPTGWFPGCMRPYNSSTDPAELNFVCQTTFLDSKDIENWAPPSQKLPFHLNRMKVAEEKWERRKRINVRKLPSSDIDNILHTLKLIPVSKKLWNLLA